jgi:uncharacterized protein YigA (DUF484 family)
MTTSKRVKQLQTDKVEEKLNDNISQPEQDKQIGSQMELEETIVSYLYNHRDFFQGREELIEKLTITHPAGQAVSLIERQVDILREKNTQINKQLNDLFSIAKENENSTQKMHDLILSLLSCHHFHEVASLLQSRLVSEFSVDSVLLKLFSVSNLVLDSSSTISIDEQSTEAKTLKKLIYKREPVCGFFKQLNTEELQTSKELDINSMAVMPLFVDKNNCFGALILGSEDKQHFRPDSGTLFLKNLAEVVSHTLVKYL